eukprot:TRINITY_DN281_c0_g1_i3.p2 TRINITY_DN281_c0_g1~~TRINITY_DN281_c0_g1_i3.p2  ORF type:complete len:115 (-),score=8.99 TRINITY_DN281_c0_g1_i3:330-674(-)
MPVIALKTSSMTIICKIRFKSILNKCSQSQKPVVVMAEPSAEQIQYITKKAEEACKTGSVEECAISWKMVAELSTTGADQKSQDDSRDPIEEFCNDNFEIDECRVFEDHTFTIL